MHIDLSKEQILVTGSSKGIGLAATKQLLASGAKVVGASRSKPLEDLGDNYNHLEVNFEDLSRLEAIFKEVLKQAPELNTVVFNAGVFEPQPSDAPLGEWFENWKRTFTINTHSVGIWTQLALGFFRARKRGRFVFIGSRAVSRGETSEYIAYGASKGAVTSLSKTIARSFGKENITSFVIAPGFVDTQMAQSFIAAHGKQKVLNELALNKLTQPSDLSALIALLCSGNMDHATGTTIDLNGGSYIR